MQGIQVQIVTWNSLAHMERLFRGLRKQKGVNFKIVIIDNLSQDGTLDWIKKNAPEATIISNSQNLGFAKAHNIGFKICSEKYALVLNPDTELGENFLLETVNLMESYKNIGSCGGILYKKAPKNDENGIFDSCGLKMTIYGKIVDINENKVQNAKFEPKIDVFGISGACVMYRISALNKISDKNGIFDERFGSYKEDVDLAWRLKKAGFPAKISAKAICYHERQFGAGEKKEKNDIRKILSRRNHILMLKKNLSKKDAFKIPFIFFYEIAKFFHSALFERNVLKAYKDIFK